jgi:protein-S-isoprenylcysteine O-methyltransferase Ste14
MQNCSKCKGEQFCSAGTGSTAGRWAVQNKHIYESVKTTITQKLMDFAHKSWWQIFEIVFGIPFIAAIILQLVIPISIPTYLTLASIIFGIALIIVGVLLVINARRELAQHMQPTDPGLPTTKVVITGVFSISRNPLYLGGVCVLTGIALLLNWPWVLLLFLPAFIACHYILIVPEEKYLADKFGKEYQNYTSSVSRWIGRIH